MALLDAYDRALKMHPIRTKIVTSVALTGLGDFVAQTLQNMNEKDPEKKKEFDTTRSIHQLIWGAETGLAAHVWYNGVEIVLPGNSTFAVVFKIFLDQTIYSIPQTFMFFVATAKLRGEGTTLAIADAKKKLMPTMKAGWSVWPMVHFITYKFVPIRYRVPWVKFVVIFWTAYLSWASNNSSRTLENKKKSS